MNCEEAMTLLSAELDGMLSETEQAGLNRHLETCESCRRLQKELREAENSFRAAQEEAPAELHTRVMSAVRKEKAAKRKELRRWWYVGAAAAAALAVAILSAVGLMQTPIPANITPAVSIFGAFKGAEISPPLTDSPVALHYAVQEDCPVLLIWTDEEIPELPETPEEMTEDGAAVYRIDFGTLRSLDKQSGRHMEFCDPNGKYHPDASADDPAVLLVYYEE